MTEDHKEWDLAHDDDVSVYTYLGLFGTGVVFPVVILILQLSIPTLLALGRNVSFAILLGSDSIFLFNSCY